jgi:Ser/Thr protein kinase RdoA (MazF antagonist)
VAWQWLPGEPASWSGVSPFWPSLIAASRAFHAALAGRPAPPWLGRDGSQWTVGDQVAWGERDPESVLAAAPGPLAAQLRSLLAALRPVRLPAQLIHGDLGGNVLFAAGEPPAVIDFSPYWRPAGLALAVAAVDALTWGGADPPSSASWPISPSSTSSWPARTSAGSSPRSSPGAANRTLRSASTRSRGPVSR